MKFWLGWGWLVGWLLAAVLGGGVAWAQVATTTVQDIVTDASGAAASGSVVLSWSAFTTAAGSSVAAGSLTTTLGAGGALSVALQPNAGGTPMGSYYTAVFHLSDGTVSREFWVVPVSVPGGGPAKLAGIRNQVLPTSVAMQTVSKQYVDTTVAKAMAGTVPSGSLPYVLKAGDAMAGPLALPGSPTLPLQAATKQYVDSAISGVSTSGAAGGDLNGSYPNPTVRAVHALSGSLDGVAIGQSTPAAVSGTTLGVGIAAPAAGFPAEVYAGSLRGVLLQASSGDDSPNLYFHGTSRWLSVDENAGHYRVLSESSPGTGGYTMLDCDGSGTIAGACTFYGLTNVSTNVAGTMGTWINNNASGISGYSIGNSSGETTGIFGFDNGYAGGFTQAQNTLFFLGNSHPICFTTTVSNTTGCDLTVNTSGVVAARVGYHEPLSTPASSSATCSPGDFGDDANYHYVCVAANSWKRVALSAF